MPHIHIVRLTLIIAIVISLLHYFATALFLYSFVWWFDIPMHLLGGFAVGLFSLWFYFSKIWIGEKITSLRVMVVALVGVLLGGVSWELFEYFIGVTVSTVGSYPLDIVKDLANDIVGGYLAHIYFIIRGYHKFIKNS